MDPHFVDRPKIMAHIETRCKEPAARIALVGLGGVGYATFHILSDGQWLTSEANLSSQSHTRIN